MKNIVNEIISRLNNYLKNDGLELPKRGLLAGQSIATIYMDIIGFDKFKEKKELKINDIDVFLLSKDKSFKNSEQMMKKSGKMNLDFIYNYGRFLGIYSEDKYRVVATKHIKSLNVTFIKSYKKIDSLSIISLFDINCTQIGLDLETKELFMTKNFNEFISKGELKIIDVNTPIHSAIRFVKKSKEFGFYANYTKELSKLVIVETKSIYFGKKYYENYLKYKEVLDLYFEIKTVNPKVDWHIEGMSENHYKADILYTLAKKTTIFNDYIQFHKEVGCNFSESIQRTNEMFYGNNTIVRKQLSAKFADLYNNAIDNQVALYYLMEKYYTKNLVVENFRSIMKVIKIHPKLASIYYSFNNLTQLMEFHNNIKKIEKIKGSSIIGVLENSRAEIPYSYDELLNLYNNEFSELSKELTPPTIQNFKFSKWAFKELRTTIELLEEGKKQYHCVGGYSSCVKSSSSKIISLTSLDPAEKDYTIELRHINNNKYFIAQCMAKFNKPIDNFWIDVFAKEITLNSSLEILNELEYKEYYKTYQNNINQEQNIDNDEIPF